MKLSVDRTTIDAGESVVLGRDDTTKDEMHPLAQELQAMLSAGSTVTVGDLSNIVERLSGEFGFAPSIENATQHMTLDECMEALSQPSDAALDEADLVSLSALLEAL